MESVTFSDGLISIGDMAFSDCVMLTEITLPNSGTYIGKNAFYGTGYTKNFSGDFLVAGDGLLQKFAANHSSQNPISGRKICGTRYCTKFEKAVLKEGVTSLGIGAFIKCSF